LLQRQVDSANGFQGMLSRASLLLSSVSVFAASVFRGWLTLLVGQLYLRKLLVTRIATIGLILCKFEELLEACGILTLNHAEAGFITHVLGNFGFWWTIVQMEWFFALNKPAWIKAIERPHARLDSQLLLR